MHGADWLGQSEPICEMMMDQHCNWLVWDNIRQDVRQQEGVGLDRKERDRVEWDMWGKDKSVIYVS